MIVFCPCGTYRNYIYIFYNIISKGVGMMPSSSDSLPESMPPGAEAPAKIVTLFASSLACIGTRRPIAIF